MGVRDFLKFTILKFYLALALFIITILFSFLFMDSKGLFFNILGFVLNPIMIIFGLVVIEFYPEFFIQNSRISMFMLLNIIFVLIWDYILSCIILYIIRRYKENHIISKVKIRKKKK